MGEIFEKTIPNSVIRISDEVFWGCTGLTGTLTLPNSVTTIGTNAFAYCSGFTGSLIIPNNVTTLSTGLLFQCSGITSVEFYANTVSNYALFSCSNLSSIKSHNITPPIDVSLYTFDGINKITCILHVPVGSLAAYQAAQYWNQFTNIIADL